MQNLDHLGIIAGLVDELEIVEQINQHLGEDPRERISPGVAVKAMILNGLGLVSAPLYLFEQFFAGKATEHLLGAGVQAEHLNDDRLGRVLDALYVSGLSQLFMVICLLAVEKFGVERKSAHLDSTSFAVEGDYLESEITGGAAPVPISITYGYSRDRRPDLKQFVMNLVCWADGDIPAFIELADGNQADKTRFAALMQEFKSQWSFEGLYVADSALRARGQSPAVVWVALVNACAIDAQCGIRVGQPVARVCFSTHTVEGVSDCDGLLRLWGCAATMVCGGKPGTETG